MFNRIGVLEQNGRADGVLPDEEDEGKEGDVEEEDEHVEDVGKNAE